MRMCLSQVPEMIKHINSIIYKYYIYLYNKEYSSAYQTNKKTRQTVIYIQRKHKLVISGICKHSLITIIYKYYIYLYIK